MRRRSTDLFLTTHTGSLPRPEVLIPMTYAKEEGVPVEHQALARRIGSAIETRTTKNYLVRAVEYPAQFNRYRIR